MANSGSSSLEIVRSLDVSGPSPGVSHHWVWEKSYKGKEVKELKWDLDNQGTGTGGLQAAQQKRLLMNWAHRPAVTLTFTLMGEWQVGGNKI